MYKYVFTSFFYTSTWVKILNTGLFTYSFNSFTYSVKQKVCRRLPRMFGAINPPHFPSNCKPNTEQQKSGKENKSRAEWMCWGLVGWRSCRWGFSPSLSLSLAAAWRATHTSSTFACAKKPSVEVPRRLLPPPACVVEPVCDLFKCLWKLSHPRDWYVVLTCNAGLFPARWVISRRDLCAGRGQKMARRSQLSVTVSALNVCLSISIPWFHLDGAEFRARWLVLKVIFGSTCPQTFTWGTKIRRKA